MGDRPSKNTAKWSNKKLIVIAILAGVVVAVAGWHRESEATQTISRARVDIELLSKALEAYKRDWGEYPGFDEDSPVNGDTSHELYDALFYDGWNYKTNGVGDEIEIYIKELDPRSGKQRWVQKTSSSIPPKSLKILDPWGRPYRYRKGSNAQNPDFDLWSVGKDGLTNIENPDKKVRENRDDIRNF